MDVRKELGLTLFEVLTVIALIGIMAGIGSYSLNAMKTPLATASASTEQFIKFGRSKAISMTVALKIAPLTTTSLGAWTSTSCSGTMTPLSSMKLIFPTGAKLTSTNWAVCFDQRGLASDTTSFTITDTAQGKKTIYVALGGGTKIK